jgi:putative transposase
MAAAEQLAGRIHQTAGACRSLGVSRATLYRSRRPRVLPSRARPMPHRSLGSAERKQVLDVLRSPRFVDKSPSQVWATLLDEMVYYCSIRTMYRYLAATSCVIRTTRSRSCWPRHPIRCGVGT